MELVPQRNSRTHQTQEMLLEGRLKAKKWLVAAEEEKEMLTAQDQLKDQIIEISKMHNRFNSKDSKWPIFTTKEAQACSMLDITPTCEVYRDLKTNSNFNKIQIWSIIIMDKVPQAMGQMSLLSLQNHQR